MSYLLNGEQAKTGVVAGMWTQEDLDRAKKSEDGKIINNWYLIIKPTENETKKE